MTHQLEAAPETLSVVLVCGFNPLGATRHVILHLATGEITDLEEPTFKYSRGNSIKVDVPAGGYTLDMFTLKDVLNPTDNKTPLRVAIATDDLVNLYIHRNWQRPDHLLNSAEKARKQHGEPYHLEVRYGKNDAWTTLRFETQRDLENEAVHKVLSKWEVRMASTSTEVEL